MNSAASTIDNAAGGGGGGGSGGSGGSGSGGGSESADINQQGAVASTAAAANVECFSEFPDADEDAVVAATVSRVDSLTLALKALQSQEATASLLTPGVSGFSKSGQEVELLLLAENAHSGCRSSVGEDEELPASKRASSLKLVNRQTSCVDGVHAKKVVRFADAMGLDLARVRHVFDLESPPEIPPQATRDLVLPPSDDEDDGNEGDEARDNDSSRDSEQQLRQQPEQEGQQQQHSLYLSPSFAQPGSAPNFNSRIATQKVVLEKAYHHFTAPPSSAGQVRGLVRVANLGFEKTVQVRASFDGWRSCIVVSGDYQTGGGGCGGCTDQFAFSVSLPEGLRVGDQVTFCVAYFVNGETYWDNNFGDNYSFHCVAINNNPGMLSRAQVWMRYV